MKKVSLRTACTPAVRSFRCFEHCIVAVSRDIKRAQSDAASTELKIFTTNAFKFELKMDPGLNRGRQDASF